MPYLCRRTSPRTLTVRSLASTASLSTPVPACLEASHVVNFATITALPMSMKQDLEAAKKAEMNHDHRVLFRTKLAWFFGRVAEDIPDDQRVQPPQA